MAWLEIDVGQLAANARSLRRQLAPTTTLGVVVKGNGYGHGAVMAAQAAVAGGATHLFVATLDEGLELRRAGIKAPILVIFPVPPDGVLDASAADVELAVGNPGVTRRTMAALTGREARPARLQLEVDTGLSRGGAKPFELAGVLGLIRQAPTASLSGVWTHLSSPDDPDETGRQLARFGAAKRLIEMTKGSEPARPQYHAAASGGFLCGTAPDYDMVRIGLAFYGVIPPEFAPIDARGALANELKPALTLRACAVRVTDVPRGTRVGYGGAWHAARPSTIATLPLGYTDGFARLSSPGAVALVHGRRVPIVGRIASDALAVDVTDVPGVGLDDEFVLLGRQGTDEITARELAKRRGSIEWEVLYTCSTRLPRIYRNQGALVATLMPGANLQVVEECLVNAPKPQRLASAERRPRGAKG